MQISLMTGDAQYRVTAISDQQIRINDQSYQQSLIVSPDALELWQVSQLSDLTPAEVTRLCQQYQPEVLLLGTGQRQQFPPVEILGAAANAGLSLEVMTTQAACRTYAVLISEGRRAVAALIF